VVRTYAGILGFLAFFVTTARGVLARGATQQVLWNACCHLMIFAALGCVLGWLAQHTIDDSVHGQIAQELANQPAAKAGA
jgi:hypothetical protein